VFLNKNFWCLPAPCRCPYVDAVTQVDQRMHAHEHSLLAPGRCAADRRFPARQCSYASSRSTPGALSPCRIGMRSADTAVELSFRGPAHRRRPSSPVGSQRMHAAVELAIPGRRAYIAGTPPYPSPNLSRIHGDLSNTSRQDLS
jgi:hypothetical protein